MYRPFAVILACALAMPGLAADAPVPRSVVDAHGGDALLALRTLGARARLIEHWADQGRRPGPPGERSLGALLVHLDLAAGRYAEKMHWVASGHYPFNTQTVLDGDGSFLANLDERHWRRIDATEYASAELEFRLLVAPIALKSALDGYLAALPVRPDDAPGSALQLTFADSRIELHFNDSSGLLTEARRTLPDGATQRIRYRDFEAVEGVPFNRRAEVYWQGDLVREVIFEQINPGGAHDHLFERPPELREYVVDVPDDVRTFSSRELAEGVWFIGEGVHYQLFVEFPDFVVALGSVGKAQQRLEELRRLLPHKPLRYALVTHHHPDHLEGVVELAQAGATLLVAPGHEATLRAALGDQAARIESVGKTRRIAAGDRELLLLPIGPNSHAEEMLAGFLVKERLLYSADMFVQPPERPLRGRIPPIRDLLIAIEAYGLDVGTLVDPHSPRINSIGDLHRVMGLAPR